MTIDYHSAQVCAEFHVIRFFITLKYGLSAVVWVLQNIRIGYWQWKIKTLVSAQTSLIDRALPKTWQVGLVA